jgi:hypothetical protein
MNQDQEDDYQDVDEKTIAEPNFRQQVYVSLDHDSQHGESPESNKAQTTKKALHFNSNLTNLINKTLLSRGSEVLNNSSYKERLQQSKPKLAMQEAASSTIEKEPCSPIVKQFKKTQSPSPVDKTKAGQTNLDSVERARNRDGGIRITCQTLYQTKSNVMAPMMSTKTKTDQLPFTGLESSKVHQKSIDANHYTAAGKGQQGRNKEEQKTLPNVISTKLDPKK